MPLRTLPAVGGAATLGPILGQVVHVPAAAEVAAQAAEADRQAVLSVVDVVIVPQAIEERVGRRGGQERR